jgi:hypothetical protein
MSAATLRFGKAAPLIGDRQTMGWLAGTVLLITLLTSETLWGGVLNLVGADDSHFIDPDGGKLQADHEMAMLIKLTEDSGIGNAYTGDEALVRNEAIPFADSPVDAARPFQLADLSGGAGLTALKCLTQAVYHEAAFEPLSGRRAVAQVVLNRSMHPAFPKSVCGVVYQGVNRPVCQFSFTCDGSLNRRPEPAAWQQAEAVARAALNGYVEPSVGYATHYHANYVSPYWAPKLVKITQIGAHIFYRWPGGWGMPRAFNGRHSGSEAIPVILPRNVILAKNGDAGGGGTVDDGTKELMVAEVGPKRSEQDRFADNDVGGRLDMSKGWSLAIPEPEETSVSSRMIAKQQAGEFGVRNKGDGL